MADSEGESDFASAESEQVSLLTTVPLTVLPLPIIAIALLAAR